MGNQSRPGSWFSWLAGGFFFLLIGVWQLTLIPETRWAILGTVIIFAAAISAVVRGILIYRRGRAS